MPLSKEEKLIRVNLFNKGLKICYNCEEKKPLTSFYIKKENRDNLHYYCIDCVKIQNADYIANNKDKIVTNNKAYYKNNAEYLKNKAKEYRKNNKEKIKARARVRYQSNSASILERKRESYLLNRDGILEKCKSYGESPCISGPFLTKINNKNPFYGAKLEENKILVKCYYCNCYFNPVNTMVGNFIHSKDGLCNMYCSDKCKELCSSHGQRGDLIHPDSILHIEKPEQQMVRTCQTGHLKQLQLDEVGYNYCEKCGKHVDVVELHHTLEVAKHGLDAISSAGHMLVCNECHKEFNKYCRG